MRENFYAELSRRLREEGIESSYAGTQNLNVLLHGQPVLCVTPSSEIFILPAGSKNEEVNDLYHRVGATADEVYEYVEAVQSSPLLRASDLKEEFRLLADFGCAVLAGRERENGRGYQFVTWVWDFDRRGVTPTCSTVIVMGCISISTWLLNRSPKQWSKISPTRDGRK